MDEIGLQYSPKKIRNIMNAYLCLSIYPDVMEALQNFRPHKLMILTNGNFDMMNPLLNNTGLNNQIDEFISADAAKLFKPRAEVYQFDYLTLYY